MHVSRIICPVDFSELSKSLVRIATAIAQRHQAELHLVHVRELHVPYGGAFTNYDFGDDERNELLRRLRELADDDLHVNLEQHVIDGDAIRAIIKFADEIQADLIVIGTHGRTGLARVLLGSVAENVVRRAHCPVLALRHPESCGSLNMTFESAERGDH